MKREFDNVVLISLDALRYDCVRYQKNKQIKGALLKKYLQTPTLNKIEKNAVCFTNAYTNAPYTTAAHAGLFTGLYPEEHGIQQMYYSGQKLSKKVPTLAEHFARYGYTTIALTKMADLFQMLDLTRGFSHVFDKDSQLAEFLEKDKSKKKFFFLHFFDAHIPYLYSESDIFVENDDYYKEVKKLATRLEVNLRGRFWNRKPLDAWFDLSRELKGRKQLLLPLYLRGISKFDQGRFRIFYRLLKEKLNADKTAMMIFADHGEGASDFLNPESFGHAVHMASDVIRIPFMIHTTKLSYKLNHNLTSLKDFYDAVKSFVGPVDPDNLSRLNPGNGLVYAESWNYMRQKANYVPRQRRKTDYFLLERMILKKTSKVILCFDPQEMIRNIERPALSLKVLRNFARKVPYSVRWIHRMKRRLLRGFAYVCAYVPIYGKSLAIRALVAASKYPIVMFSRLDRRMEETATETKMNALSDEQREEVIERIHAILKISKRTTTRSKVAKFVSLLP